MKNINLKDYNLGTKITFNDGTFFIKSIARSDNIWSNNNEWKSESEIQDNYLDKIIKIEEPTYKEINFKAKEDMLDKEEENFIKKVIKIYNIDTDTLYIEKCSYSAILFVYKTLINNVIYHNELYFKSSQTKLKFNKLIKTIHYNYKELGLEEEE